MPPTDTKRSSMMAMTEKVCLRTKLYGLVQQCTWNEGRGVGEGL